MTSRLITGGTNDPFLPHIREAILQASEIEIAVAFIKSSGLGLIYSALEESVIERGAKLSVLTSDYLDVTDPQALRDLMLLAERGADVRVFRTGSGQSFHLKAYIFVNRNQGAAGTGVAFVGSSNISHPALTSGIEWNYRVLAKSDEASPKSEGYDEIRHQFAHLWARPEVAPLDFDWIKSYEARRPKKAVAVAPGSADPEEPRPSPTDIQREALAALSESRSQGNSGGLVVLATGMGKTYLAAFDAEAARASRVLFVAHRDEILLQAEKTFLRVHPNATVGRYTGTDKDTHADMIFASIQTLSRQAHLGQFASEHFDYIVVDEFHHAAAATYRKLLNHFDPKFLLGLTATPDRTDQSDILALCGDNVVFNKNLFFGVEHGYLCPFTYFGIHDSTVDYEAIPWRNGRFDPDSLSNKLATLARFRHVLREWEDKARKRTLAFCVSKKHAQFMADRFQDQGIKAAAVYGGSEMARDESLVRMRDGDLDVIFSVDLFSEGVDVPEIDTVMMLRPTDSKVLFLQQLGRGLRNAVGKERLIILDFIGNHKAFLNKPQALCQVGSSHRELAEFGERARRNELQLPAGCFINFDLEIIDFLASLGSSGPTQDYRSLRATQAREERPTLTEYFHSGASLPAMRKQFGSWLRLVESEGDLSDEEISVLEGHDAFMRHCETMAMTKSFKAVLLESFLALDGFIIPPTIGDLAREARRVFRRRRRFISDLHADVRDIDNVSDEAWLRYWETNPINAWVGGNLQGDARVWFEIQEGRFVPKFDVKRVERDVLSALVQETVDYRLAAYAPRLEAAQPVTLPETAEIPMFDDLAIACGHFRGARAEADSYLKLGSTYGPLQEGRHFVARAAGDSMDGGDSPVRSGDYLLLEHLKDTDMAALSGAIVVVERPGDAGAPEYVLRSIENTPDGQTRLNAANPQYPPFVADKGMRPVAKLSAVVNPMDTLVGQSFLREEIAELFGEMFNPGNWHSGHVVLGAKNAHILLVTLNKQGKAKEHRYNDYFDEDGEHFHWQSQNNTGPEGKRGQELIHHEEMGIAVHLFVRENKLAKGKAAPFLYHGRVRYMRHGGSRPMSVVWGL